jgi:hypothetical protein
MASPLRVQQRHSATSDVAPEEGPDARREQLLNEQRNVEAMLKEPRHEDGVGQQEAGDAEQPIGMAELHGLPSLSWRSAADQRARLPTGRDRGARPQG